MVFVVNISQTQVGGKGDKGDNDDNDGNDGNDKDADNDDEDDKDDDDNDDDDDEDDDDHHGLTLSSPEPVLGRFVRLQRVTDPPERESLGWKEVTVISTPADLSQEEQVKVLVDSTVM